jgi:hypothetical protein
MKHLATFSLTLLVITTFAVGSTVGAIQVPLVFQTGANPVPGDTSLVIQIQTAADSLFTQNLSQSNWLKCQPYSQFTYNATFPDTISSMTYYWRGRLRADTIYSSWSSVYHFTLNITQPILALSLSPAAISTNVGDIDTLWISLGGTGNRMKAALFNIAYDHNLITINDVIKGSALVPADNSFLSYDIYTDSVVASLAILDGVFTGTGELLGLIFTSTQAGSTNLSFNNSVLRDSANQDIQHTDSSATVQIQVPDTTRPTVLVSSPASGDTVNSRPTLSIRFRDNLGFNRGYYHLDNCSNPWTELWSYNSGSLDTTISWRVPAISEGRHTIYFKIIDDWGNVNLDTCSYSWNLTYDTTPPNPPTNLAAKPGNLKCKLSWINPSGDFRGVEIRRNPWATNAYPEYDDSYPTPSGYPQSHTAGQLVYRGSGTSYRDSNDVAQFPRNIYFYSIFAYDRAGNYSRLSAGDTARATNYILGDVDADGMVYFGDLATFAGTYDTKEGEVAYLPEFDIGPTVNNSSDDIPLTDNKIDFEDLVIFAMNYMVVTQAKPLAGPSEKVTGDAGLSLNGSADSLLLGNQYEVKVSLVNNQDTVKSIHFILPYDSLQVRFIDVKRSYQLVDSTQPVFFYGKDTLGQVDVSFAILGANAPIIGSGEIAVITFELVQQVEPNLSLSLVDLRDVNGRTLDVNQEPGGGNDGQLPTTYHLNQNYPNPFNPSTNISYDLPKSGKVSLRIFNIKGELVKELMNEYTQAGYHTITWDGKNKEGLLTASGIYFYQIVSEGFAETRKMILMK